MQQPENQQAEANVLWLAQLECPGFGGSGKYWAMGDTKARCRIDCSCQGTSARYPQLRQECPCIEWIRNNDYSWTKCLPCSDCEDAHLDHDKSACSTWCQGRKWNPVSREKAATELHKLPEFISLVLLHWPPDPTEPKQYRAMFWKDEDQCWDFAADPDNATIAAARKMAESS